ncbi:50S ribosomal protein L24 [Candidatus Shapirobacteria bacterium]|nr:50S ribosomal protein L24 [Candidatus Shapirobacteria bacterium]
MKLKTGDQVIVLRGKDKGRKGKIQKILPTRGWVIIPGVNIYKRHQKAQSERKPGGIIDKVFPLPIASVALWCGKCNQKTRVGFKVTQGEKHRVCKKCGAVL